MGVVRYDEESSLGMGESSSHEMETPPVCQFWSAMTFLFNSVW